MKLTIERSRLLTAMTRLSNIIPKRHGVAVLSHVLIDCAPDGRVVFRGTNLDIEATMTTQADVETDGACCVVAETLLNIAKNAADGADISLTLGERLAVKSGRSRFNLSPCPTADFPVFAPMDAATTFTLACGELHALIGRVAYAQCRDAGKQFICGVRLFAEGSTLGAVATDGKQIAVSEREHDGDDFAVTIPVPMAAEMVRLLGAGEIAHVSVNSSKVRLAVGDASITGRILSLDYANYKPAIPAANNRIVTVEREAFSAALRRVLVVDDDYKGRSAKLSVENGSATVTARGIDADAVDEVEVQYDGEPILMGVNPPHILDALAAIGSETVELAFGETAATLIIMREPGDAQFFVVSAGMRA